ncbi:hypothetical protein HYH02_003428 [Chlamydomonas schloesseri]|uniref:AB hydrolase-1 domain-containing protein n=1 Tax=Chlamydomonas schloesseri TaxID=2026947 RepID=A0A835WPH5_9CHLO|nr:hypothetical protein HYH02_003428 [Chlamydomonas schloesseri]|eukprot:KAG2451648.1 hypothetical protein HYH02_003428 [Chlamydomonas schloesseri]
MNVRAAADGAAVNPFANPAPASAPASTPAPASPSNNVGDGWTTHTWKWRGYTISYKTAGCGEPILLVHGFGLSSFHYRHQLRTLGENYKVYAIDLLGFGGSSKPIIQYSMELWRDLLVDFMAEFMGGKPAVLVGNSIGGLACLMTNVAAPEGAVRGTVLLNSAGAMNNKGVIGDWRIVAVYPLLLLIDFLLSIPAVSAALFKNLARKENISQILKDGVYRDPSKVDERLVEEILAPSQHPGAREVFVSVITGPPGPKPWQLIPELKGPLLVLWGDKDTLTPADGPVGKYLKDLPSKRPDTSFIMLEDVGHCLHDDRPELVHSHLLPWLEDVMAGRPTCRQQAALAATAVSSSSSSSGAPAFIGEDDVVAGSATGSVSGSEAVVLAPGGADREAPASQ